MKKVFTINKFWEVEFVNCSAIDGTGKRKPAIFVHRRCLIIDFSPWDSLNSVVFGGEMPQSVEEADRLLDAEDDDPEILGTVILEDGGK